MCLFLNFATLIFGEGYLVIMTVIMQFCNSLVTLACTVMSRRVWSLYTFSLRVTCKFLYIFGPVSTLLECYRCCRFVVLNSKELFRVVLFTYDYECEH